MQSLDVRYGERESLRTLVWSARAGEVDARNTLIRDYRPFIVKIAAAASRRYLRPGFDDEITVAMMAFNEAIDSYALGGKVPFLSFAQLVIRRRLVDYFREQARFSRELPLSFLEGGEEQRENRALPFLVREAEAAHARWEESVERRDEILRFRGILATYGLSLLDLVRATPKHADTRERLVEVSRAVAANVRLVAHIRGRKALPISGVATLAGLSHKTIERHRKYLLALVLVLLHDLPCLRSYLE